MTTTVSLFWIVLFVFIMHTALCYSFAHLMHSDKNSDESAGIGLALLEFVLMVFIIGAITF